MDKSKIIKIIGNLLMCVSLVYIIVSFTKYDLDFSFLSNLNILFLVIIFIFTYSGMVFIMGYSWTRILRFLSRKQISYSQCYPIYAKSGLGKYIPGNFMHYAARNIMGSNLGMSQLDIGISSVIEVSVICITAFIWSCLLAGTTFFSLLSTYTGNISIKVVALVFLLVVALTVLTVWIVRHKNVHSFLNRCRELANINLLKLLFGNISIQTITFLIPGFILVVIISWNAPILISDFRLILAAFIVSWVIGFVVPGAPGGIGVREAVLTLMLQDICAKEAILIAVVIQRLISVLGDLSAYIISLVLVSFRKTE